MPPKRTAFTLIELLVVIAIIAVLIALLVPAVQKVREAAGRAQCQNNLRQLAVAAHHYHNNYQTFPFGYQRGNLGPGLSVSPQQTLFILLLPYYEQDSLARNWDMTNHNANKGVVGSGAVMAQHIKVLVCPSDSLPNPAIQVSSATEHYGLTSYGGNAGRRSYRDGTSTPSQTLDGVFFLHRVDQTANPQFMTIVGMRDIIDGTSSTFLFGERDHLDPNFDLSCAASHGALIGWGWWAFRAPGDVTLGAAVPINYQLPATGATTVYCDDRINAFGSRHSGGANFGMADGSVKFISQGLTLLTLQWLSTRNGGEAINVDY